MKTKFTYRDYRKALKDPVMNKNMKLNILDRAANDDGINFEQLKALWNLAFPSF